MRAIYERIQPRDTDPMLDFDERDLVRLAEDAGFYPINLTLEAVIEPLPPLGWQGFLDMAGNPNIPTFKEAMEQALTATERRSADGTPSTARRAGRWKMENGDRLALRQ